MGSADEQHEIFYRQGREHRDAVVDPWLLRSQVAIRGLKL